MLNLIESTEMQMQHIQFTNITTNNYWKNITNIQFHIFRDLNTDSTITMNNYWLNICKTVN